MSGSDDSSINKGRCGKSKKKIVMRIEFDDSDGSTSQDDPVVVRPSCSNGRQKRRRNRRRVISSDESDCSTDSEVIRTVIVRGRNNARAVIPEDDMDETNPNVELDQNSIDKLNGGSSDKFVPTAMKEDGFTSDSSTDNGLEKCPICLLSFRNQEIGTPNTCDHLFCALCIEEWSRNVKTCPIDRKEFTSILVKESFENKNIVREVKIEKTEQVFIRNEEDLTRCEICNQSDREDVMLLCDGCNHGFHMDCLTPALTEIPEGFWYCDNCFESESDASSDNFELLYEDLREIGVPRTRLRIREVQQPRITRTRQSERIRASIVRTRASRNPQSSTRDAVETSSRQQGQNIQEVLISRATTLLRTKPRKRSTRRRRYKTYVVEYDLNTSEKFPIKTTKKLIKRRRRIRKTKRSNSNRLSINNSRCQEASLGRAEIGVTFSLFGNANELEYFSDESDVTDTLGVGRGETGVATMASTRANRYSTSTLLRQKGVMGNVDRSSNYVNVRSDPTPAQQPDVLSNILEMQSFWHSSAASRTLKEVKINPDGSLNLPKTSEISEKENKQTNTSSQSKGTDSSPSVENNITQAPMYPRGGNHNYSNRGGGGNYNNRFNNQSSGFRNSNNSNFGGNSSTNVRHSTGGLGGSGFNSFQRDSNFQPEHFQPRHYGSPDFRNRQRNQNNTQNNRRNFIQFSYNNNLLPPSSNLTGSANANITANPLFQNNNNNNNNFDTSIAHSSNTALREIGPQLPSPEDPQYSLIVKLNQSDTTSTKDDENSKNEIGGVENTNDALDIPLPLYSPTSNFNETEIKLSGTKDTDKDIDGENPQNNDNKASNAIPPLQPPPWNNNLFRLAASYDDQDDDEDCPNFSVYSAESFQVARSGESAVPESSDKDRQEDEYEEKQEDLVQLGDDDEIPNAIDNRKVERAQTDSDIYDPEDPNNDDYSERDTEDNENHIHEDEAIASPTTSDKDDKEDEPKVSEFERDVGKSNSVEKEDKEDSEDISEDQKIIEPDRTKLSKIKKGVLELYDDSDWEEWNIDKSEVYKSTKPQITEPEVKTDSEPAEDAVTIELTKPEHEKSDIADKETAESVSEIEEEEERSYTPCLDEKVDHSDAIRGEESPTRELNLEEKSEDEGRTAGSSQKDDDSDRAGTPPGRILGLETELISDEDEGILNEVQGSVVGVDRKKDGQDKKAKKGQFKKISKNTKVRNYRDKDGIKRKRSNRSRSRSDDKENRRDDKSLRKKTRRKDMERYDVRNVINQPRSFKDRYGRDTSRPPRSRSGSRATRSKSRSISRRIRSTSRSRSVRRSFSMSPTPPSYGKYTPQSRSPRRSRSIRRSRSYRRTPVAKRRGKSPIRAGSLVRRRSVPRGRSPFRARSPQRLRSPVHARTPIRPRSRSFTQSHSRSRSRSFPCSISGSPPIQSKRVYRKRRSQSNSISRSRSPVTKKNRSRSLRKTSKEKRKRSKDRKKKKTKRHSIRESPVATKRPPRRVDHNTEPVRKKKRRTRSRSPVEERFSQTPPASTAPINTDPSWTPPLASSNSENLRVILNNKELLAKKKKEKKKKIEKRREKSTNKERRKRRSQIPESPLAPSKEVFASGDNILVSVSFNKENAQPQQTTVVTLPPTREEIVSRRSPERQHRKIKKKDKVQKRHKKIDAKPVAIIDLDRSPFQVIAQSPKDVIILTDSEREAEEEDTNDMNTRKNNVEIQTLERTPIDMRMEGIDKNINVERSEKSAEKTFDMPQLGPKTPPEPPIVKFSLATKIKQIKSRNPLHEQEDIEDEIPEKSHNEEDNQQINKIGPNTPPESGPCSPDAYDPFDPTKSPSASPSTPPPAEIPHSLPETDSNVNDMGSDKRDSRPLGQDKNLNPVDLVMALMTSKQSLPQDVCKVNPETSYINSSAEISDDKPDETSMNTKSISVLSNVLITPGKHSNVIPPIASPQNISKLSITKQPAGRINGGASNEDMFEDLESPYSPGSADYEDLFEPPPENPRIRSSKTNNKSNKVDIFDHLFGSSPVARMQGGKKRQPKQQLTQQQILQQHRKYSVRVSKLPGVGMDQEQIKIYDDLPSSAVELQVKDKYVRKLHRQERVVEEVKLVLKPYYTKKVINKEVYKEILRRSVPKICHSRSGEINPKKIQNLVEAYVRKFRQKLKLSMLSNTGQVSSASKCAAYLKKL